MIRALAMKELHDCAGVAVVGGVLFAVLLARQIGLAFDFPPRLTVRFTIPFIGDEFYRYFVLISVALTVAMAVRQVSWEIHERTCGWLLLRPLQREAIFGVKLAIGCVVLLTVCAAPILLYAAWSAMPGTTPTPFQWWMTSSCWSAWLIVPTLYLGAFLSAIRVARWFGTRLLPFLGAGYIAMLAIQVFEVSWIAPLVLLLTANYALVAAINYSIVTRDY